MSTSTVWFDGWAGPLRVLIVGVVGYVAVAAMIRVSGKRTLGKFNAFDWVGTVAIGSTLANLMMSKVPLVTGLAALALLVVMQFVVSYLAMRSDRARSIMRSNPAVLLRHGAIVVDAAHRERVTDEEIVSAVRRAGGRRLEDAQVVVLESDGHLTAVLERDVH